MPLPVKNFLIAASKEAATGPSRESLTHLGERILIILLQHWSLD
jgi:hypothetical protein